MGRAQRSATFGHLARIVSARAAGVERAARVGGRGYGGTMLPVLLLACAHLTRTGVVVDASGAVELRTYNGEAVRLGLDEGSEPIRYLNGVVVEVTGPAMVGGIRVRDWFVKDAGDGTGGFVGVLRAYGGRIVMDDRNTKTMIILEDGLSEPLRPWIGQPVLVVGTVVGGNIVRPVAWRLLAEEPGG